MAQLLWIRDLVLINSPGAIGLGMISLTDVRDLSAIFVALVSAVCTLLITADKLLRKPPPPHPRRHLNPNPDAE